ncbi:Ig-like domain-containing protein, partial [Psychromonas marina]|uniref:Ig-like domain-containing protein n=1 Tax=Psychromonas marina TaxID=88364 RepID=UPI0024E0C146
NFNGVVPTVTYTVSNGESTDDSTLLITVNQVNDAPMAIDDGLSTSEPYTVNLGDFAPDSANNSGDTNWKNIDSTGSAVSISASDKNDGADSVTIETDNVSDNKNALGVNNGQIDFDSRDSIDITFNGNVNTATVNIARIYSYDTDKNSPGYESYEQGQWIAYKNGVEVASGIFTTTDNNNKTAIVTIDTGDIVFDSISFEALEQAGSNDQSDYFITGITASGSAEHNSVYEVTEDQLLDSSTLTVPARSLLNNDSDPDGDALFIVDTLVTSQNGVDIQINADGTFIYDPSGYYDQLAPGQVATDTFEYTISDGNGGTDTATATITIIGTADNYSGDSGGTGDNTITGTDGNDVIVSDVQYTQIVKGGNFNIAFILDTSGSMGNAAVATAKEQLTIVFNQLITNAKLDNSGTVNVLLVDFDTNAQQEVSINLNTSADPLTTLTNAYNSITNGGWTNYEAAFQQTTDWFTNGIAASNDGTNVTYFITDGVPNAYLDNNIVVSDVYDIAKTEALAAYNVLKELSEVEAIGIKNDISLDELKPYDSDSDPSATVNVNGLSAIILGSEALLSQGNDTVDGGAGNDIIFGDLAPNSIDSTDGYLALQTYVAGKLNIADVNDVTIADVHHYVSENTSDFDTTEAKDGNDKLNGGDGRDIIFGQGGDDTLTGGLGNDLLIGGEGADTFVWLEGDTGIDHIQGFDITEGDKLDLSDLLQINNGDNLNDFLDFDSNDGDTIISVHADGGTELMQTIVLDGVDLGSDDVTIINDLLAGTNNESALFIADNATITPSPINADILEVIIND